MTTICEELIGETAIQLIVVPEGQLAFINSVKIGFVPFAFVILNNFGTVVSLRFVLPEPI